jgi:Skp family chaperone for outer membrane proteins
MSDPFDSLALMLSDVVLPDLKSLQLNQSEQIAANDRLEHAIQELGTRLESKFARLNAELTACQAELAATQAALRATQTGAGFRWSASKTLVH